MSNTPPNTPAEKWSVKNLDMRATVGCSYKQCKKEALVTIVAYLIFAVFTIASCGIFGYGDISYTWGIPTWILLGIFVPTIALIIYLAVYLTKIYKD